MSTGQNITDNETSYRELLIDWIFEAAEISGIEMGHIWKWFHNLIGKPCAYSVGMDYLQEAFDTIGMDDLKKAIGTLYHLSIHPHKANFDFSRRGRPTERQRLDFFRLACMADFLDPDLREFRVFVKRVAKVDSPCFLTRSGIVKVIAALKREIKRKAKAREEKAKAETGAGKAVSHSDTVKPNQFIGLLRHGQERSRWGEAWWCSRYGKSSFDDLTEEQARWVLQEMTWNGLMRGATQGQTGRSRPTPCQWERFTALALALGWEGANDPGAVRFIRRETGVDHPRFLNRSLMREALAALRAARGQRQASKQPTRKCGGIQ